MKSDSVDIHMLFLLQILQNLAFRKLKARFCCYLANKIYMMFMYISNSSFALVVRSLSFLTLLEMLPTWKEEKVFYLQLGNIIYRTQNDPSYLFKSHITEENRHIIKWWYLIFKTNFVSTSVYRYMLKNTVNIL